MKEFFDTLENINSKDLCNMINTFREEEGNEVELQHKSLLTKIKKEIEIMESLGTNKWEKYFSHCTYVDKRGRKQPCYTMDKYGALQILNSESAFVRYKTVEYIKELEKELLETKQQIINEQQKTIDEHLAEINGEKFNKVIVNEANKNKGFTNLGDWLKNQQYYKKQMINQKKATPMNVNKLLCSLGIQNQIRIIRSNGRSYPDYVLNIQKLLNNYTQQELDKFVVYDGTHMIYSYDGFQELVVKNIFK